MGPASHAPRYCCGAHAAARSVTFARGRAWTGRSRLRMPRTRHCRACRHVHRGSYPEGGVSLVDDSPMLTSSLSIESSAMKLPAGHEEAQSGSGSSASSASSSGLAAGQHSSCRNGRSLTDGGAWESPLKGVIARRWRLCPHHFPGRKRRKTAGKRLLKTGLTNGSCERAHT
jgi:hypothetical protein